MQAGRARAPLRGLLADGSLYVSHFAGLDNKTGTSLVGDKQATEQAPGQGRWILLSLAHASDIAPHAGTPARAAGPPPRGRSRVAGKQGPERAPGRGRWILLSLANASDIAPNAGTAAGAANTTVGA